ncbi:bifunctional DNA primase/polymerase [Streptomyces kaniharaensis]|uniref:bifunctional DNA primase/polymerase n=1 Tax=Streptomyces kaniharaensis TaxID=212423 RepID=UPI0018A83F1C|nr:bifunctional DNA primase/polymerase [Streptomyces kaniharaensis]
MTTVAAAVDAVRRGLVVFKLPAGGRVPERGWHKRCLATPEAVERDWTGGANIGVACRAAGVVGLDLDVKDGSDGAATLHALCAWLGHDWPDTLTVRTPSGGQHLYFRAPTGRVIASTSGGRSGLGPGIDVRGPGLRCGGYLIGPGSVVNHTPYVITRDIPLQPLPGWLTDQLDPNGEKSREQQRL